MNWARIRDWNWKKFLEVSGWVIGVAALAVGVVHVWEIRHTADDLDQLHESLAGDLRKVQASLSTQFAGTFPTFVDDVIRIIQSAQRDLVIVCDYPAYADYSEPKYASTLLHEIEQKIQAGVKVQLVCMNRERRRSSLGQQFGPAWFKTAFVTPAERRKIQRYLGSPAPPDINYDQFLAAIENVDSIALERTFRNAEILQVDAEMPIFFWIADGSRALMVVQTFGGQDEYGFTTSDQALINALLATRDRYARAAVGAGN